jgi:site-specific recombinase XerD
MASYGFNYRGSVRKGSQPSPGRLYLRIVHAGESRSVTTEYRIYPDEWNPTTRRLLIPYGRSERGRQLSEIEHSMLCDTRRLDAVIHDLEKTGPYSADQLMRRYRAVMTGNTIGAFSEKLASELEREGHQRTANTYRTTAARFLAFNNGQDPGTDQLSTTLISDFQASLKGEGCSMNTISFYMRTLRAIYNKAVAEGRTPRRAENLFDGVYTGVAITRKLALTSKELAILSGFDPTIASNQNRKNRLPNNLGQALAMFLFCYHARGMCFVDMAYLKKSNLRGDTISYHRHKTDQLIELRVLPTMRRIIDWFAPLTAGSEYLFPIITDSHKDTLLQYTSGLRLQNKRLKKIAELCGIKKRFSTHSARHSWATVAKSASLPLAVISEGLGHSNQRTTEIYLASLERSVLDHASRVVSNAIIPEASSVIEL